MKTFCLDTETTAGMRDGRVVQFAIVDDNYKGEWLVNPPTRILPGTIKVHRITPDMVKDKPTFFNTAGYQELKTRLDEGQYLIAHHAKFDITILANEGIKVDNYICSCKVAREILKPEGVPKFGLQFLKDYLKLEELNSREKLTGYAHSALYDTMVLHRLYKYLHDKIKLKYPGRDPNEVMLEITHDAKPMTFFRFGKYKGRSFKEISEIDRGYIKWLYKSEKENPAPRPELLKGLELYL